MKYVLIDLGHENAWLYSSMPSAQMARRALLADESIRPEDVYIFMVLNN